jgi:hypothetical protein
MPIILDKGGTYSIGILVYAKLVSVIPGIDQKVCPELLRSQLPVYQMIQQERVLRVAAVALQARPLVPGQIL